jgi:hypothetical protein
VSSAKATKICSKHKSCVVWLLNNKQSFQTAVLGQGQMLSAKCSWALRSHQQPKINSYIWNYQAKDVPDTSNTSK